MNKTLDPMFKRRSIRSYEPREVDDAVIHDILEAGMAAPSAVAKDPWDVVVVKDRACLARIADGLPNGKMLADAAFGLVVVGDPARAHDNKLSYLLQDCGALVENMLLAASMLGLGACWLGVHPREERLTHIRNVLGIPESHLPIAVIAAGYPAEDRPARTRYDEGKVHWERWE